MIALTSTGFNQYGMKLFSAYSVSKMFSLHTLTVEFEHKDAVLFTVTSSRTCKSNALVTALSAAKADPQVSNAETVITERINVVIFFRLNFIQRSFTKKVRICFFSIKSIHH